MAMHFLLGFPWILYCRGPSKTNLLNCENTLLVSGPLPLPAGDILCDGAPEHSGDQVTAELRGQVV